MFKYGRYKKKYIKYFIIIHFLMDHLIILFTLNFRQLLYNEDLTSEIYLSENIKCKNDLKLSFSRCIISSSFVNTFQKK